MWKDSALLLDILIAAKKARDFTSAATWATFTKDELLQNAVVRMLTITAATGGR